jgi:cytochrome c1
MTLRADILSLAAGAALTVFAAAPAFAQLEETPAPPREHWSFSGPFGKFNRAQLQRGFKVYQEVCSTCHGLSLLSFRNLTEPGGPEFTAGQVNSVAAQWLFKVQDGPNDQGEMFERVPRLGDPFPPPFPNDNAARARYNAVPPDMSVLAKARGYERGFPKFIFDIFTMYQEKGVDYIAALMQGYSDPPKDFKLASGLYYNTFFPGHALAMPPPLTDGRVEYTDGSPQTVAQYAKDIGAFLMWAAEPHLEARKKMGFEVMVFLIIFAGLMYFTKKRVWKQIEAPAEAARGETPVETM